MTDSASGVSLPRVSLLVAAGQLSKAIDATEVGGSVYDLQAAIRQAMGAVEDELGGSQDLAVREPRLRPAIERFEVSLAETLVLLWQTRLQAPSSAAAPPELLGLARRLRRLADQTVDLLHDSMQPVGGEH